MLFPLFCSARRPLGAQRWNCFDEKTGTIIRFSVQLSGRPSRCFAVERPRSAGAKSSPSARTGTSGFFNRHERASPPSEHDSTPAIRSVWRWAGTTPKGLADAETKSQAEHRSNWQSRGERIGERQSETSSSFEDASGGQSVGFWVK